LTPEAEGTLSDEHDAVVDVVDARPEVAWGTSDLFGAGAPIGALFELLPQLESLR
jgi:hypothetical protein